MHEHRVGLGDTMAVMAALVATSFGIMVAASVWGWRNGTFHESTQERYDREFHQLIQRLRSSI